MSTEVIDSRGKSQGRRMQRTAGMAIIGGWLSEADGTEFIEYASKIGIGASALATLLLVRELNHDRMASIIDRGGKGPVQKDRRITARIKRKELKERFAEHARKYALSSDAAAAAVFRAELSEKWLEKCVSLDGNHIDSPR